MTDRGKQVHEIKRKNGYKESTMSEFIYTEQRDQVLLLQIRYEQTLNCLNNEILKEIAGILRE